MFVWRAERAGGDTKTPESRRTLALPRKCVEALREHRVRQAQDRLMAGPLWQDHGLVFASAVGTPMDDHNVRRMFRAITEEAGLGTGWVPREMRHTFVSLLSARGVPVEAIALLAGHNQTVDDGAGIPASDRARADPWRRGHGRDLRLTRMPRTRTLRDEPPPGPVELVFRGILGDTGLDPADLRQAAVLNHELYGFYGVSVWVADLAFPRELLESTKLVKFERYAEFTVADLTGCGLRLWATGQRPHYDVVEEGNDLESLIARLAAAPHRIVDNRSVDREEH